MDPVTAAGLALGIIPLLISAIENYEVTFRPFVIYQQYSKEVQRFTAKLKAQHALFNNECQLLLNAVGHKLADILRDLDHPARNDEELSKKLRGLLGASYSTCISILELINDTLCGISKETKGLRSLLDNKKPRNESATFLFRQRIKISFSKMRLTAIINDLRSYNSDFCRLSAQIQNLASDSVLLPQRLTGFDSAHLQITRRASDRLYDALASVWACDDQVEHIASLSLKVDEHCLHSESKVRFNLAVTCVQPSVISDPLWLAIESAPSDATKDNPNESDAMQLAQSLQKMGAVGTVQSSTFSNTPVASSHTTRDAAEDQQTNLSTIGRLCHHFRQIQAQAGFLDPYVGFLEITSAFKHFVYRNPISRQSTSSYRSISLKQILKTTSNTSSATGWVKKLGLAKLLALSLLRFHDTKWLSDSWSSDDIGFLDEDTTIDLHHLPGAPYFNKKLSNIACQLQQVESPNINASSLAANEALFNLGVVLIELGNNATFENLSQTSDLLTGTNRQVADWLAARRLGEAIHENSNPVYKRLVQRCLNCSFSVTRLEDPELQSAVMLHVVNQLDICIRMYQEFNSLDPLPMSI